MAVLRSRWLPLAARLFLTTMGFLFIWDNPGAIPKLFEWIGWPLPEKFAGLLAIPLTAPVAGIYGFASDALLGFIPGLRGVVPQIDGGNNK